MTTRGSEAPHLAETPPPADALIGAAMELLATAISSLGERQGEDDTLRTPSAALASLAAGTGEADPLDLGVPVTGSRLTVVVAPSTHVLDAVRQRIVLPKRALSTTTSADRWLLLVPGLPRAHRDDVAMRETDRALSALCRAGVLGWHSGVSASLRDASDLPGAYRDAADLAALATRERRRVLTVDDDWARLTIARVRASARSALPTASPLDVLDGYDRDNETAFRETLAVWLSTACDTQQAARALCIHVNTLRYRLRRAATIAALDLQDPHQRLVLQLTGQAGQR